MSSINKKGKTTIKNETGKLLYLSTSSSNYVSAIAIGETKVAIDIESNTSTFSFKEIINTFHKNFSVYKEKNKINDLFYYEKLWLKTELYVKFYRSTLHKEFFKNSNENLNKKLANIEKKTKYIVDDDFICAYFCKKKIIPCN